MTDRNHGDGKQGPPQHPRSEPEIMPPDQTGAGGRERGIWVTVNDEGGTRRVFVARPGPFTIVLALAILGLIAAVMLIVLLSVALIWIPLVIILIATLVLSMTFSRYWQRFRSWLARR